MEGDTLEVLKGVLRMPQDTVSLLRRYMDACGGSDLAALDDILSPDFVGHDPDMPPIRGRDEFKKMILACPFGEMQTEIADVFGDESRGVIRWHVTGTHVGEVLGVPPTGKTITFDGVEVVHIDNGKITESWWYWDALGLAKQLGALPADFGRAPVEALAA